MRRPNGPIKYVIINGKNKIILLIPNFCESFTIQPPVNKLIEIKCIQNKMRKVSLENRLDKFDIFK